MTSRGEAAEPRLPGFAAASAAIRDAAWTVAADAGGEPATIVVDSLDKTFRLEELLHAGRDRNQSVVLDPDGYLFDYIRTFSDRPECVLPDRADMTSSTHCLRSYTRHVLDVASRRGARIDAPDGDEPGLFLIGDERVVAEDLLQVPRGRITEQGMRQNIQLVLRAVAAILDGDPPAERASTIELCRAQLWQWVRHETGVLDTGRIITPELFERWLAEELAAAKASDTDVDAASLEAAAELLQRVTVTAALTPSLVDEAYRLAE